MQELFETKNESPPQRPDWMVVSSATRAQATAEFVLAGCQLSRERLVIAPELYEASPEDLLGALRETPDEVQCVALVAHNPGLTWLVNALSQDDSEPPLDNLPTLGCALFAADIDAWSDLQQARLVQLITPKSLRA